jgi:hypothetical protein
MCLLRNLDDERFWQLLGLGLEGVEEATGDIWREFDLDTSSISINKNRRPELRRRRQESLFPLDEKFRNPVRY